MRLNKFVRDALGIARRKADDLIFEGKIMVNGEVITEPWYDVKPEDRVEYKGKVLKLPDRKLIYIFYKPVGVVSSLGKGREGYTTIRDILPLPKGLKMIGRLDKESEGLMVLTNDGRLVHELAHPSKRVEKHYLVWTKRPLDRKDIKKLLKGVWSKGEFLKPDNIIHKRRNLYLFILHEGKKHEIRRLVGKVGNSVIRLKRIKLGPFELPEDMEPGELRKYEGEL